MSVSPKCGRCFRCICLLDHPVPNTKDQLSTQIIIPQKQVNRKSDIYVTMVSYTHQVASKNWFVAMVSTNVETDNPEHEIQPGVALLGPVKQKFLQVITHILYFSTQSILHNGFTRKDQESILVILVILVISTPGKRKVKFCKFWSYLASQIKTKTLYVLLLCIYSCLNSELPINPVKDLKPFGQMCQCTCQK